MKSKLSSFIPILNNFDYTSNPVGLVDITGDNIVLKLNDKQKITIEDINTGKAVFAPTYVVYATKGDLIKEILIDSFSLIRK